MKFSSREIALEAVRNMMSARLRTCFVSLLAMAVGLGVLAAVVGDVAAIRDSWVAGRAAGSDVLVVRPMGQEVGVSAVACDALRSVDGVLTAGAVLTTSESFASVDPASRYAVVSATPGYLRLAWPTERFDAGTATVAGVDVATPLGLSAGAAYLGREVPGGSPVEFRVGARAAAAGRFQLADRAVVVAEVPSGDVPECAVESTAGARVAVAAILTDWFAPTPTTVQSLLPAVGLAADPQAELNSRWSRWVPLAGGGVLLLVSVITWWGRRGESGLYLLVGMHRGGLLLQFCVEVAVSLFVPVMVGAGVALVVLGGRTDGIVADAALRDLGKLVLVVGLVPLVSFVVASTAKSLDLVRGR